MTIAEWQYACDDGVVYKQVSDVCELLPVLLFRKGLGRPKQLDFVDPITAHHQQECDTSHINPRLELRIADESCWRARLLLSVLIAGVFVKTCDR
jgi:hypothetical protein